MTYACEDAHYHIKHGKFVIVEYYGFDYLSVNKIALDPVHFIVLKYNVYQHVISATH